MLRYGILSSAAIAARFIEGIRQTKEGEVIELFSLAKEQQRDCGE